jgi:ABC-2 type transport system ATP-binding protein
MLTLAPPESSPAVVRLQSLWKIYRGALGRSKVALRDVSLEVRSGEVFGLLGPNGAGKTTLTKLLLGLARPSSGRGEVFGHPLGSLEARRRVGFLPESPYFYDALTPGELLDYVGRLSGLRGRDARRRAGALLERLGVASLRDTPLRKLSKGNVQRVGIAQAVFADPDLVLLDEPMSGLDPVGRRDVRDLILSLRSRGTTVFFSSHILHDVEMISDRIGILRGGSLLRLGTVSEIVGESEESYEIELEGLPERLLDAVLERAESVRRTGGAVLIGVSGQAEATAVLRFALANGGTVRSVNPKRESLEEFFVRVLAAPAGTGDPGLLDREWGAGPVRREMLR